MATTKKKTATPAKKKATASKGSGVILTENAIVISLDAATQKRAKNCLAKNGKVTFSISEHKFSKIPGILYDGMIVD